METRRQRKSRAPAKKFVVLRFRANALPSWASIGFPNRVGIPTKKAEKVDRFSTEPFAYNREEANEEVSSPNDFGVWPYGGAEFPCAR
jgi:hypothetical protein